MDRRNTSFAPQNPFLSGAAATLHSSLTSLRPKSGKIDLESTSPQRQQLMTQKVDHNPQGRFAFNQGGIRALNFLVMFCVTV